MIREWILFFYLGAGAFLDGRYKRVPLLYLLMGGVLGGYFLWVDRAASPVFFDQLALRMTPGIGVLIYSRITKERIGYGDGIMMIILGGFLTYPEIWWVWCGGILLFVMTAGILYLCKRIQKNTKLPFFPFLWMGYLAVRGIAYVRGISEIWEL